jgi:hypothetical protein
LDYAIEREYPERTLVKLPLLPAKYLRFYVMTVSNTIRYFLRKNMNILSFKTKIFLEKNKSLSPRHLFIIRKYFGDDILGDPLEPI